MERFYIQIRMNKFGLNHKNRPSCRCSRSLCPAEYLWLSHCECSLHVKTARQTDMHGERAFVFCNAQQSHVLYVIRPQLGRLIRHFMSGICVIIHWNILLNNFHNESIFRFIYWTFFLILWGKSFEMFIHIHIYMKLMNFVYRKCVENKIII